MTTVEAGPSLLSADQLAKRASDRVFEIYGSNPCGCMPADDISYCQLKSAIEYVFLAQIGQTRTLTEKNRSLSIELLNLGADKDWWENAASLNYQSSEAAETKIITIRERIDAAFQSRHQEKFHDGGVDSDADVHELRDWYSIILKIFDSVLSPPTAADEFDKETDDAARALLAVLPPANSKTWEDQYESVRNEYRRKVRMLSENGFDIIKANKS